MMKIADQKSSLNTQIKLFSWIGGISAIVALIPLIWAGYQVMQTHSFFKENELGDFIGGTSGTFASFSALAFVYVGFLGQRLQILIQQEELELNRKELQETRKEIEGQKEQLELQNRQFQIQSFETVFFHLLETFREAYKVVSNQKVRNQYLETRIEEFIDYSFETRRESDWRQKDNSEKKSIYQQGFSIAFSPIYGDLNSLLGISISILNHIERNHEIVDSGFYLELFYNSLSQKQKTLFFYSFFDEYFWLDQDKIDLFRNFLKYFDPTVLLDIVDYKLINN